ncbi:DUF317 domain-containing protein [Streptomyces uncialis]|uniref:DUF317 domain-containing protein n=1 Tax=Streptomyces uncialis TaxID=1048205 RepID=UPI002E33EBB5|nr:DUF317 domain-containing protein [Streptomyces uncialis]
MLSRQQLDVFADDHTGILDDIAPRYLAGPGDARHITHALAAAGWKVRSDPLAPVVDLVSPDLRYRLRHEPQTMAGGAVWRLRSNDPHEHWYAQFTAIPAEILAGLTDQLVLPRPVKEPPCVWDLLADADWSHTTSHGDGAEARSPDALVSVEHRRIAEGYEGRAWRIEVRPRPDEGPVIWTAWIAYEPPPHLISALAATLADPAPLQRTWTQNRAHYSARRTESRVTSEAHVAAHRARIETVRARVRAARRANSPASTTPSPAPPPSLRQAR